ncbi:hypothetical protein ACFOHS_19785 [Jhaorihella thermophila]
MLKTGSRQAGHRELGTPKNSELFLRGLSVSPRSAIIGIFLFLVMGGSDAADWADAADLADGLEPWIERSFPQVTPVCLGNRCLDRWRAGLS